jgi:uncharacterized repeat protein (TIGR01451 family)
MTRHAWRYIDDDPWARWITRLTIALAAVVLCSCRTVPNGHVADAPLPPPKSWSMEPPVIPSAAEQGPQTQGEIQQVGYKSCEQAGEHGACAVCAQLARGEVRDDSGAGPPLALGEGPGSESLGPPYGPAPLPCSCAACSAGGAGAPLPLQACGEWKPPGIACPWPDDEYLCDGGDRDMPVAVAPDWTMYGLETEDAVAHFDTLDGRTLVEPSNRVCVYAPRFAAVRTVTRIEASQQTDQPGRVALPTKPARHDEVQIASSSLQREQAVRQVGAKLPEAYETRQGDGAISTALRPTGFEDSFLAFENLVVIRSGRFDQTEKARLAQAVASAITWTSKQAVQIEIDHQTAVAVHSDQSAQLTFVVDDPRHNPRLRLIKVASTDSAQPGETVDFTLRFDNTGDQVIGNVVIVDNLTTRLEYVPNSSQASVKADFRSSANEGQSLALRWEITDPIEPGKGGIIRFQCRVR